MSNAAPGFYDDGAGRRRWWDGGQWTEHYETSAAAIATAAAVSPEQKQSNLSATVSQWAANGWTVQFVNGDQAVLRRVRRMGWFWNTVAVIFTGGLWLIYVIYRALNRNYDTAVLNVDAYGNVHRTQ